MGVFLNDPKLTKLRIKIGQRNNRALVALASAVHKYMLANVATYATPAPTLATLATQIAALKTAMALTDFKRNRGSKAQIQNTLLQANVLRNMLGQLLAYAQTTAANSAADNIELANLLAQSGYGLKKPRAKNSRTQMARFVQQNNSKLHPPTELRLRWKKPLGVVKGLPIAGYNIKVGGVIVATTTNTVHTFTSLPTPVTSGFIVPFNARGEGTPMFFTMRSH